MKIIPILNGMLVLTSGILCLRNIIKKDWLIYVRQW